MKILVMNRKFFMLTLPILIASFVLVGCGEIEEEIEEGNTQQVIEAIPDQTLDVGGTVEIEVGITDADSNDVHTISATSDNTKVATPSVKDPILMIEAVGAGAATITVSVTDDSGQENAAATPVTFKVTVNTPIEEYIDPSIYWVDASAGKIQRANLDGSNIEDLVTQGLEFPDGIALDIAGGKMYWTDWHTQKIRRANLDGSNIEDLTQRSGSPHGIALDVANGKMYWTNGVTQKIRRANLDGSNIEDLITQGLRSPAGIALDVSGGKMYWTDINTEKIQRANLDGSNIEDLITQGLEFPNGIALDVANGKMYWANTNGQKIQRANLDGSNIEDLVTRGTILPIGITLDVEAGKMYWTDVVFKIRRANLDGSNVEDLVTQGLHSPRGIALGIPAAQQPTPQTEATVKVENNFCSVGDVLQPGESCLDGTGDAFTVLEDGSGRYLFFNAGKGINLFGNINGKVRNFSAEKQDDGTWKILSVTPKE